MNYVYLDIETIPVQLEDIVAELKADLLAERDAKLAEIAPPSHWKDEAKIAEWHATTGAERRAAIEADYAAKIDEKYRATSFDGAYGQIAVIGAALNGAPPVTFYDHDWRNGEARVLRKFYAWLEGVVPQSQRANTCIVGHYVVEFDLRILFQRSVIHCIKPPAFIPFNAKPWDERVFDTMTRWAGSRGSVKLDKLCRVLGIAGKGAEIGEDIDGSRVWDYVQRGEIDKVAAYCAGDVERARQVHRRLAFISEPNVRLTPVEA